MREAWSFFDKSAEMKLTDYLKIIKDTAKGKGNWSEVLRNENDVKETESSLFFSLTPRQRSILTLCTTGNSPQEIAKQLGISYSYVRKELSRAYAILLPDADQGSDLKTAAVLKYMELLRMS
jgi:DNA-binding NarL/FixJ family response regulator